MYVWKVLKVTTCMQGHWHWHDKGRPPAEPGHHRQIRHSKVCRGGEGVQGGRQPDRAVWRGLLQRLPGGGQGLGADQEPQGEPAVVLGVRLRQPPVCGEAPALAVLPQLSPCVVLMFR